jgi:hypothetical protein
VRFLRRGLIVLPAVALALAGWLLTGCGRQQSAETATSVSTPADRPVELVEVSAKGFERALQEQKGKVVLVDGWFLG